MRWKIDLIIGTKSLSRKLNHTRVCGPLVPARPHIAVDKGAHGPARHLRGPVDVVVPHRADIALVLFFAATCMRAMESAELAERELFPTLRVYRWVAMTVS